jgi:hypothetical protein
LSAIFRFLCSTYPPHQEETEGRNTTQEEWANSFMKETQDEGTVVVVVACAERKRNNFILHNHNLIHPDRLCLERRGLPPSTPSSTWPTFANICQHSPTFAGPTLRTRSSSRTRSRTRRRRTSGSTENWGLQHKSPLKYVQFHYDTNSTPLYLKRLRLPYVRSRSPPHVRHDHLRKFVNALFDSPFPSPLIRVGHVFAFRTFVTAPFDAPFLRSEPPQRTS